MKTVLVLFAVLLSIGVASSASAQTVTDWTKTDCDGIEHNLFAELDSGCVVIMDFAMTYMGGNTVCPPCSTASSALERIKAHYDSTNPGKVHHYAMSYSDTYDCDNMNRWKEQCGFVDPAFPNCEADVKAHYGPSGMPLIVVVGPKHTTLKKITSWSASGSPTNETAVQKAVDQGLAQAASVAQSSTPFESFKITQSASAKRLEFDLKEGALLSIDVLDVLGKQCAELASQKFFAEGHSQVTIPSSLITGSYILRVRTGKDTRSLHFIQD